MDAAGPTRRSNRAKSVPQKNTDEAAVPAETAPNLNGNKDGEDDVGATEKAPEVKAKPEQNENPSKTPTQGSPSRRKASLEVKLESSEAEESMSEVETEEVIEAEKKDESQDESISVPEKQQLGKGKRARIPNKRYSDIMISPRYERSKKIENGENQSTTENTDATPLPSSSSPSVAVVKGTPRRAESPLGSAAKKRKVQVDLTNPNYLKPFQQGWKRELVYRATADSTTKRNGDIYYYTPSGKKVRSMREVSENLEDTELTLDDFTFYKEPLGLDDPDKEIIRDAKLKIAGKEEVPSVEPPKTTTSTGTTKRNVKSSVGRNTPEVSETPPKPVTTTTKAKQPAKTPATKAKTKKKPTKEENTDMEMGTYPPNWTGTTTPTTTTTTKKQSSRWANNANEEDKQQPCSIRCKNVWKPIPSLQCRYCLCLYHNECVGLSPVAIIDAYVCKNCQLRHLPSTGSSSSILPPPPLTPISAMKSSSSTSAPATSTSALPKLQRMPKQQQQDVSKSELEMPKLTPRPGLAVKSDGNEQKSLLGSVTTWFPPSSTIQVGNGAVAGDERIEVPPHPRPQIVEYLGQKKFLIVPKHNVLSVSPPDVPSGEMVTGEDVVSAPFTVGEVRESPAEAPEVKEEPISPKTGPESAAMEVEGGVINVEENEVEEEEAEEGDDSEGSKTKHFTRSTKRVPPSSSSETKTMWEKHLQDAAYFHGTMLYVFQYLKVQDLLRAGCVCKMWYDIANHRSLWRTVKMKNSQIYSFHGLAEYLHKHQTVQLDLRKTLLPPEENEDRWNEFSEAIKKADGLRQLELCKCPATVVEKLPFSNPKLEYLSALSIKCENLSLEPFTHFENLKELKLRGTNGLVITSELTVLKELKSLKSLTLTSIKDLPNLNLNVFVEMDYLECLELGECTDLPITFGKDVLSKLINLEKLRLEKGQGNCNTFEILEVVKNMPKLEQLELVNFDIKTGFDKALGACKNIKKLLIIPTYISQSATTNHMVLGAVLRLQNSLTHFVWGVTLELLRVTELFVDQCEDTDKKEKKEKKPVGTGDSIPVLKPVPLQHCEMLSNSESPQVEILPLPNLQRLLLANLPTTRVKILKIPFHATWRQTLQDAAS